jgi:hypothetical protein
VAFVKETSHSAVKTALSIFFFANPLAKQLQLTRILYSRLVFWDDTIQFGK